MRKTNTFFLCPKAQTLPQPRKVDTGQLHAVYFLDSHNHGLIVDIYPVQMMTIMGFNRGMHVPFVSVLVALSNYGDDDDDDDDRRQRQRKKKKWVYEQNNSSARASSFLVHLFDVHCTNTT